MFLTKLLKKKIVEDLETSYNCLCGETIKESDCDKMWVGRTVYRFCPECLRRMRDE